MARRGCCRGWSACTRPRSWPTSPTSSPREEAAAYGLLNRVVADDELDAFVDDWARRLAEGPPLALAMTKTLLDNAMSVTMAQALEDEARCQTINFYSEDTGEAMRAFAEKREPRFKGR